MSKQINAGQMFSAFSHLYSITNARVKVQEKLKHEKK